MIEVQNIHSFPGWEEGKGYQAGLKIKTLHNEKGVKTVLLRIPAGYHMEQHSHDYSEQQLVLEGQIETGTQSYPAGSYVSYAPHQYHGPYSSKKGALILVIWDHVKSGKLVPHTTEQ